MKNWDSWDTGPPVQGVGGEKGEGTSPSLVTKSPNKEKKEKKLNSHQNLHRGNRKRRVQERFGRRNKQLMKLHTSKKKVFRGWEQTRYWGSVTEEKTGRRGGPLPQRGTKSKKKRKRGQ